MLESPFDVQLDDLLQRICEKLQISYTQQEQAEDRYEAVGAWLSDDSSLLAAATPRIYPQGSLLIGTTVKPQAKQEYDVDLVCELNLDWEQHDPVQILNVIELRLREKKQYEALVERMNRCIRLSYANEFHMDILPACPDCRKNHGCVKVPDRKAGDWKDSNPKGYAEWFEERSRQYFAVLEKAAIEPLPEPEPASRKSPLKRSVQLIKRHRDIYFKDSPELAPLSIILTTLAAWCYRGQASVNDSLSLILQEIVRGIPDDTERLIVRNPTNHDEDFSEKWDQNPDLYESFVEWVRAFHVIWRKVNGTKGIHNVSKILKEMFGETVTNIALKEQAEFMEKSRKADSLRLMAATGTLTTMSSPVSIPVKRNTFHGQ